MGKSFGVLNHFIMHQNNIQKAIIYNAKKFSGSTPYVNHSSMALVRYMMSKSPADFEGFSEQQIRESLYNAEKKKYIKKIIRSSDKKKVVSIQLTRKGKKLFQECRIEDIKLARSGKWDGEWRIIIFDVPQKANYDREFLRNKLKTLGFFRIQHSAWVYPYDCMDEIELVIEYYKLSKYVLKFTAPLKRDGELIEHFRKKGLKL